MDWLRNWLPRQQSASELQSLITAGDDRDEYLETILLASQQEQMPTAVIKQERSPTKQPRKPATVHLVASCASVPQQQLSISQQHTDISLSIPPKQVELVQKVQLQMPTARNAIKAVVYGLTNLGSVVAIVMANKLVLHTHGFRFAITLTWLHCIFSMVGMVFAAAMNLFEIKRVPMRRSLPLAMAYVGSIVANNMSIQINPVGFYQISKIAITPVIVCIEWLFYSKSASPKVLASIVVLLAGIALATVTDSQVASQPVGMLVAGVNVVVTGLYQVWAGTKQKELGLNGLQLLHQVSPSSVLLLALLIPCLEPVGWSNPTPDTILGYHLTPAAGFWIVVSSALGLVVTLSTFLFIGATSSLTYNVIGHMKTVLIVTGGVLLFGDTMGIQKLIGLLVAMSGIVWYSQIKMAEANKQ